MKIHAVFHVFLLELYRESTIPKQLLAPLTPIKLREEEKFKITKIIESQSKKILTSC